MTPLGRRLAERIAAAGPITVAEFMAECLLHPEHGYYATRDPLGVAGDFTTAPEISQMFGELLGIALAQAWLDRGRPTPFVLAELGPGRGTLMADALRACRAVPGFADAAEVHLVEASPPLRTRQAAALGGHPATWHQSVASLPEETLLLVANEFLDALPIRQFVRSGEGWRERVVGLDGGELSFGLAPAAPQPALDNRHADTRDGDIVERSPAAEVVMAEIGRRIGSSGGAAIVIDYGGWRSLGDTLQAVRAHGPADPLARPGDADLTAHVDFAAVSRAAAGAGAQVSPMVSQGVLLERLGITARARRLADGLNGNALAAHVAAHRRLTHPDEMGRLFQAIAIHDGTPPPGFDA